MSTISKDAPLEIIASQGGYSLRNGFATTFRVWQVLQDSGPSVFQLPSSMGRKKGRERGML